MINMLYQKFGEVSLFLVKDAIHILASHIGDCTKTCYTVSYYFIHFTRHSRDETLFIKNFRITFTTRLTFVMNMFNDIWLHFIWYNYQIQTIVTFIKDVIRNKVIVIWMSTSFMIKENCKITAFENIQLD